MKVLDGIQHPIVPLPPPNKNVGIDFRGHLVPLRPGPTKILTPVSVPLRKNDVYLEQQTINEVKQFILNQITYLKLLRANVPRVVDTGDFVISHETIDSHIETLANSMKFLEGKSGS